MQAQNIIFTGVAGTGKTYRLQQLAKEYTEVIQPIAQEQVLITLVEGLSWREVICLIFLKRKQQGQELLKVAEIIKHKFFQAKADISDCRDEYFNNTVWGNLQKHSSPNSTTVICKNRASQAFFDKDTTSNWYLLESALPLLTNLQNLLDDYQNNSLKPKKNKRFAFVSFHQNYGYDEFVEGIRPIIDEKTGQMRYQIKAGAFLRLCEKANADPQHKYAMLIDEINRANVMQVFGELMSLIEPNKRQGQSDEMAIELAYSGKLFTIPNNIDIFATMNTQDYSLVNLDSAFRRRFQFVEILPNSEGLGKIADIHGNIIDLAKILDGLNQKIIENLGEQYQLGQAYFYRIEDVQQLLQVMVRQILPQLISHTTHQPQVLDNILNSEKMPWLVNYRINPKLYNSTNHKKFLTLGAFESFYK